MTPPITGTIVHEGLQGPKISPELQQLHPVLARIYAARGVQSPDEVQHLLKNLALPHQFLGMPQAIALLTAALQQQQRMVIVGDFDADGVRLRGQHR